MNPDPLKLMRLIADEMMIRLQKDDLPDLRYKLFRGYLTITLADTCNAPAEFGPRGTMLPKIGWTIPQVVAWLESVGARKLKNVRREKPTYSYYD